MSVGRCKGAASKAVYCTSCYRRIPGFYNSAQCGWCRQSSLVLPKNYTDDDLADAMRYEMKMESF